MTMVWDLILTDGIGVELKMLENRDDGKIKAWLKEGLDPKLTPSSFSPSFVWRAQPKVVGQLVLFDLPFVHVELIALVETGRTT